MKHVGGVKRALSLPPSRKGQTHNTSRAAEFCSPDRRVEPDQMMTHAADAHYAREARASRQLDL